MATKASLIREVILRHPDFKLAEIAQLVESENEGVKCAPQEVSKYKNEYEARQAAIANGVEVDNRGDEPAAVVQRVLPMASPTKQAVVSPKATPGTVEAIVRLKEAADALGGPSEAKRILDLFGG